MIFIDSTSNLDDNNLKFFNLITHWVRGAFPLSKYFTKCKISKTVIINKKITFLKCSQSLHACSVPRSRAIVPGKIQTKQLQFYLLERLYVKI